MVINRNTSKIYRLREIVKLIRTGSCGRTIEPVNCVAKGESIRRRSIVFRCNPGDFLELNDHVFDPQEVGVSVLTRSRVSVIFISKKLNSPAALKISPNKDFDRVLVCLN